MDQLDRIPVINFIIDLGFCKGQGDYEGGGVRAQGLINVDQLDRIPVINFIINLPVIRSIITAVLPGASVLHAPGVGMVTAHQCIAVEG